LEFIWTLVYRPHHEPIYWPGRRAPFNLEMKLYHKINKLTQRLTYRRAWRRAQRSIFRLPLGPLRADIDAERLREIQQRYAGSPAGYATYANVDPWLRLNRERVQDLKLHRSAPKHLLDLGC